jgi:hypothetical protein
MRHLPRRCMRCALLCLIPTALYAHSFGTPYTLPVPFWMYLYGCGATLVLTFAMLGYFWSEPVSCAGVRPSEAPFRALAGTLNQRALMLLRIGAAGSLLLTISAGLIGNPDPSENIAMTLFWVVFLLGFAYFTALIGDLYSLINPWKMAVEGLERIGVNLSISRFQYPKWMSYWPAFTFYVGLIWLELFGGSPFVLSCTLIVYSAITVIGTSLFGKSTWLRQAEVFSVFFQLIGMLAPIEYGPDEPVEVRFRAPFAGTLNERPPHISLVLIVLFMLSSTVYDGIHDTTLWIGLFWRNLLWLLQPLWGTDLGKAQNLLMSYYLVYRQIGLLLFPFLYLGFYLLILFVTKSLLKSTVSVRALALDFCYSLIPIAFAYNFTHYFSFFVTQGSHLVGLISDPFGFGWNVLCIPQRSGQMRLQMGVVWHTQVGMLLLGHVAAVYLAHVTALRTFTTRRDVIVSQIPLLLLMVVYTMLGLWILSLPLGSIGG